MLNSRVLLLTVYLAGIPFASEAAWLRCIASGHDHASDFAIDTAVVNVGKLSPERLERLKHKLLAYVGKGNPDATKLQANCATGDDPDVADAHFARSWMAMVRRLGWANVLVITPDVWLADTDYKDEASADDK